MRNLRDLLGSMNDAVNILNYNSSYELTVTIAVGVMEKNNRCAYVLHISTFPQR